MSVHALFVTHNLAVPLVCLAGIGQVGVGTEGESRSALVTLDVERLAINSQGRCILNNGCGSAWDVDLLIGSR
ncbi:hypothetical protein L210DRAFT_3546945 [Boletus edulis BED1]|uniref:Uncharacterized protein n=1 Tax=Boletus edulis BED1 TaxID=1328754 RepID=A0AAD4GD25_BOLED|nr:hypothetical protein L210DRAFT_3546945 [Boletus edulis BED1]